MSIERRSLAAYYKSDSAIMGATAETVTIKEMQYAIVRSPDSVVQAVYRVQNNKQLKKLRRWPKNIG